MAQPRLGQKRSDGKVYAGENYGYQNPATFSKLKDQGKFKVGAQALDRVGNAIQQTGLPAKAKEAQNKFREVTDKIPGIKAAEQAVNKGIDRSANLPSSRVAEGGAIAAQRAGQALNVDPRLAAVGGLLLGRVAVGGGASKGTSTVRPGTTARLPKSARPAGTVRAGSAAPSRALTEARRSVIRPNAAQTARQASGPAHPFSDSRQLAPGNSPAKQAPISSEIKRGLKEKAQTQHADIAERGYQGRVRRQSPGRDTSNYLPNNGRVSPTDKGKAAQLQATYDQRLAKALEGKSGADRVAARNAFNKVERRAVKDIRRNAIKEAQQYQSAQEAKLQKGSTPESMESMSADMAKRPRTQPIRNTSTTTTGTRRVAENPSSGTSRRGVAGRVVQGKNGAVTIKNNKGNLTNNPRSRTNFDDQKPGNRVAGRSINPATGRPYSSKGAPSASTRQPKGGNPQENFPSRPGRAKMEGEFRNRAGGSPIKTAQTQLREAQLEQRPGFVTRATQKPGQHSGGTGLTRRYQQNASGKQVRHNPDTTQRRNGRKIGRLGQAGQSNVDNPELRKRAAANKARTAAASKPTPTPPKRTPERAAQIRQQSRATTQGARATRGMSDREVKALQNKYNKELPTSPTTHFNGEVRLQGSKYSMDPQAKNLVDGSVSRTTGGAKNQGRSADASAQSKATMDAVRRRAAVRQAAERVLKGKKVKSRSIGGRARARGTGETRRLSGNQSQRTIRGLLQRLRGR
jgi:hypothetical protein